MICSTKARKAAGVVLAAALAAAGTFGVAQAQQAPAAPKPKAPATDIPTVTGVASNVFDLNTTSVLNSAGSPVVSIAGTGFWDWDEEGSTQRKPDVKVAGLVIAEADTFVVSDTRLVVKLPALVAGEQEQAGPDGELVSDGDPGNGDETADNVDFTPVAGSAQDVVVSNSVGSNLDTAADDVTLVAPGVSAAFSLVNDKTNLTAGAVTRGPAIGGTSIQLLGDYRRLQKATKVTFGSGTTAVAGTITRRTTVKVAGVIKDKLTVKTPALAPSATAVNINVHTPAAVLVNPTAFTYDAIIQSASATTGQSGDIVVLKGVGFTNAAFYLGTALNSVSAANTFVVSDTEAVVKVPTAAAGSFQAWGTDLGAGTSKVTFTVPDAE